MKNTECGGAEKYRKDKRITVNVEFASRDKFIREYVTNISKSGMFVATHDPLPVGTKINLKFTVMIDGKPEVVEGEGEVVRVLREGLKDRKAGMGVAFTALSGCSAKLIEKLLLTDPKCTGR
ncbi:MAG: TIGR02266 family protein [Deltaproteobacteria bacterium]|nr:TIGR02266 family protein [Deltaproteobacteria bacterium]